MRGPPPGFDLCMLIPLLWAPPGGFSFCPGGGSKPASDLGLCCASFLAAVPRVLAQVYHSLGTQLPEALLALLPADFFSDESVSKDSVSPSASASVSSPASEAGNQLQSLRDRSAHRRRRWGPREVGSAQGKRAVLRASLCCRLSGAAR